MSLETAKPTGRAVGFASKTISQRPPNCITKVGLMETKTFDFDKLVVPLRGNDDIPLNPGDKVLRERVNAHGSRFCQKAVVVRVTPKRVTIDERYKGRTTGTVVTKRVSVERWYLHRHNWAD